MVIVHHLENSRSQRVLWALEELGVPYEVKKYERDPVTNLAPESLKKVHPLGKSPVITDQTAEGVPLTIAESGAIIEYLALTYGKENFTPALGTEASRQYNYWMHFSEGSLMQQLLLKIIFDKVTKSPMPFFAKPIAKSIAKKVMKSYVSPNIRVMLEFIENHLSKNEWFTGDVLTGADIQMSFPLEACVMSGTAGANYPSINAYVKRIHARAGYQKGLEIGGPYDYA
ncbi:MAG: glutathione S-transferase [Oleiphilaceae bacterium]|jgi:glutathione S-transferase